MKFLKLILLALTLCSFQAQAKNKKQCAEAQSIQVFIKEESGEIKPSTAKCQTLRSNTISHVEVVYAGLKTNTPFYFEISAQDTPTSQVEIFRCGHTEDLKTLQSLAQQVLAKTKAAYPHFVIDGDYLAIEKISQGGAFTDYAPNNYPSNIMSKFAFGPGYPYDLMSLDSSCQKIK